MSLAGRDPPTMLLAALLLLFGQRAAIDPRACIAPSVALRSQRDTAAYCAEQFVERNGYADVLAGDREMIALEPMDVGSTMEAAVDFRRNIVARGPIAVCEDDAGFTVVFHTGDPHESSVGRAVRLDRRYQGITFLSGFVKLAQLATWPRCGPPPDWGVTPPQ